MVAQALRGAEMLSRLHDDCRAVRAGHAIMLGALLALSGGIVFCDIVRAADTRNSDDLFVTEGPAPKRITVIVNKSRTYNVGKPFARAVVGSVDYADVLPLSDRAI